jgi:hypothetical protein
MYAIVAQDGVICITSSNDRAEIVSSQDLFIAML